ncbi:aldo/keto reductase [Hwanghaeella grinnelliae]|uniref:Aldo/keto reductase n=1 Tax=Hwanghaeella grinnelliae TaxID=2500179 RepID=A0A3S3USP6_9PROT|nr:aldo/keto reductase [Hwanghaeella grinnelliae]RVU39668.1 aldo/keto reductase [Hwanghaeella grinnelliae]
MAFPVHRREFLIGSLAASMLGIPIAGSAAALKLSKRIPATGEMLPAIGMGTWITFNVGPVPALRAQRAEVLRRFFSHGGGMIDSSPMYGTAEDVLGDCFQRLGSTDGLFSASKVWTRDADEGRSQLADSFRLWGIDRFNLMQVHNLVNWEAHLPMLAERKKAGRIRYLGVTTSHGSRHAEMAQVMKSEHVDFVQLTYNILDREAEVRLLPMAADLGKAVIANRPFRRGSLPDALRGKPLPEWSSELGIATWPEYLLKFIISHPAITCAIPATSQIAHMDENMRAMEGPMPDAAMRRRMIDYVAAL